MNADRHSESQSDGYVTLAWQSYLQAIDVRVQAERDEAEAKRQYEAERQRHYIAFGPGEETT